MTWSKLKDEFKIDDIGGRLLANLAKGIYTHEAVLREYVQNAADAYQQLGDVDDPIITITVEDDDTLTVHDKGIGMDEQAIREAKRIAVSSKADLGLTGRQAVRDLWQQKDLGEAEGQFTANVPRHGAVFVKIGKR